MKLNRRKRQKCMTTYIGFIATRSDTDEYDSSLYGDLFDMYDLLLKLNAEDYRNIKGSMKDK